jgi:hypothetical protein
MSVFEKIKSLLGKGKVLEQSQVTEDVPSDFCPNCWGRQEYGGNFYEAVKNEGVDINNINEKKGWIEAYATKNLNNVRLHKKDDGTVACKSCKVGYKQV